jgi:menaquinol-cytochrome c reductase iron-sulfur subunit
MRIHSSETHTHEGEGALPWEEEELRGLLTRRRFLGYLGGLLSGVVAAALALPLARFYVGNAFKARQARWLKLGPANDIRPTEPKLFRVSYPEEDGWHETTARQDVYAVTANGQDFVVLSNVCTHLGCPVHWDDKVRHFLCPCHGGEFAADGSVLHGPPPRPLIRLAHKIEDGVLYVQAGGA